MSDTEFEDAEDLDLVEDLDEEVLEDEVLGVEDDVDDLVLLDDDLDVSPEIPVAVVTDDPVVETPEEEDDDVVDLDEELHPDDVEEPLDVLLQERTASATLEDDEEDLEEDEGDADDRVDGPTRIVPRRPGEFLCSSCFLVLPRNQLADEERVLCRDCA
jgi:hypothetical protein